jgi:Ca2+-binding RTX toxin-like protein
VARDTHVGVGVLAFTLLVALALAPAASAKRIVGNKNDNKLAGTGKRDEVFGRDSRDVLIGFDGWDRLYGEEGNDVLVGRTATTVLWGSGLDDTLDGGRGNDLLRPGFGRDVVDAGPGNDVVWAGESDGDLDSIDCGPGFDQVVYSRRNSLRRDRAFNCESARAVRGQRVPGRIWVDTLNGLPLLPGLRSHRDGFVAVRDTRVRIFGVRSKAGGGRGVPLGS